MGAKTAMVLYAEGDVAAALRVARQFDRAATAALVERLFPGREVVPLNDSCLDYEINPDLDTVYAGVFSGLTVICAGELSESSAADLRQTVVAQGNGRRVIFHSMHSVSDFLAFAVWGQDGTLERALCVKPNRGVVDDRGDRLAFEQVYWAGEHPVDDDDDDGDPYPFPFHPLELGEAALAALCGFVLEGSVPDGMPDLEAVPLAGFRLARPTVVLERSHGPQLDQPSPEEVEAQVRRLGHDLDYVVVEVGEENYLQAAAGGAYDDMPPVGVFQVERREGSADLHFMCRIEDVDEVAQIFRGYLRDRDGWGDRAWEQIQV